MLELIILSIIQGITEFFPISSSGHLVLFQSLLGFDPQGSLELNVLLHLATFFSILVYFKDEIQSLIFGLFQLRKDSLILFYQMVIASIPAAIVGFTFKDTITSISTPFYVSIFFLVTATYFYFTENKSKKFDIQNPYLFALIVGLSQSLALLPGVSRSGITLSTALLIGASRVKGAKFSFLIGLPAIFGACLLTFKDSTNLGLYLNTEYLVSFAVCFLVGYFSIKYLMKIYQEKTLIPFANYLLLLGVILVLS